MVIDLAGFKSHLQFEEGMDDSMLSFYLEAGKKYAERATGKKVTELSYFIGGIFYTYRVPEGEMGNAFESLTPLILQEGLVEDDAKADTK